MAVLGLSMANSAWAPSDRQIALARKRLRADGGALAERLVDLLAEFKPPLDTAFKRARAGLRAPAVDALADEAIQGGMTRLTNRPLAAAVGACVAVLAFAEAGAAAEVCEKIETAHAENQRMRRATGETARDFFGEAALRRRLAAVHCSADVRRALRRLPSEESGAGFLASIRHARGGRAAEQRAALLAAALEDF